MEIQKNLSIPGYGLLWMNIEDDWIFHKVILSPFIHNIGTVKLHLHQTLPWYRIG